MFTTGQWTFAAFFVVVFVAALIYGYRKDLPLHKKYYKNSYLILICFLLFIVLLFVIKVLTKDTTN